MLKKKKKRQEGIPNRDNKLALRRVDDSVLISDAFSRAEMIGDVSRKIHSTARPVAIFRYYTVTKCHGFNASFTPFRGMKNRAIFSNLPFLRRFSKFAKVHLESLTHGTKVSNDYIHSRRWKLNSTSARVTSWTEIKFYTVEILRLATTIKIYSREIKSALRSSSSSSSTNLALPK